jgi:hypothetical protein
MLWVAISRNPLFAVIRRPPRYRLIEVPPFDAQPVDATRLNVQGTTGTISTLTAGVYNLVTSYLVPNGFDGVINNVFNKFSSLTGPQLQDGSGWIRWAIQINNYLAFNYTNILMQQGDTANLGPIHHGGGIRIKPNDLIQMFAVVNAAGIATLDPNGLIIGALQGWVYASQ